MTIVDVLLSLVVLIPMGAVGVAALWRARLGLDPLEWFAYGVPLGWVTCSLVLLGATTLIGQLSLAVVIAALFLALSVTFALWSSAPVSAPRPSRIGRGDPVVVADAYRSPSADPVLAQMTVVAPRTEATTGGTGALALPFTADLPERSAQQFPAGIRLGERRRRKGLLGQADDLTGSSIGAWAINAVGHVRDHISPLPVIVFGVLLLVWAQFWSNAVWYEPNLSLSTTHFFADWPLHLGDVASMVYGNNFPMQAPRFAGEPYGYHYLATFTAALITRFGVLPGYALAIHSLFGMIFCLLVLYAFARRLLRRTSVAVLGTLLFFLGGSFAWLLTVQKFNATGDLWQTLRYDAWDFGGYDRDGLFAWNQVISYPFLAQRAFLYGIPLFLLILTLLLVGLRRDNQRLFIVAALVTGTLPFANGSVTLALPMILPFLALLFPVRPLGRTPLGWVRAYPINSWLTYGLIALALALPQVYLQQGSGVSGLDIQWAPGWNLRTTTDVGNEPWWWYAVKNFGFLLVLIPLGFLLRNALTSSARRLLLAVMPLFLIAQLITFQPLQGDNAKLVLLWYLAGALVAAATIGELWRRARSAFPKVVLASLTTSLLLTGILIHVELIAQDGRGGIAQSEELVVGERVRNETMSDGLFAVGQWHTNPVLMIGGRSILIGWGLHVWPHGYDATDHEAALREIMRYGPGAEDAIARYGVDYVAITPAEVEDYDANPDAYLVNYPLAISEGQFLIFAVSPEAIAVAQADGVAVPGNTAARPVAPADSTGVGQ
ncbi:MAG: hypothetical protein AVDCRST_MAG33-898 [uncultured Thermomicrobiales bacterium]|uniref:Uncharacterized protein n=1 Tax=uncultured Thermomicrobiales bacterium TaxID=1645740 RepID=A0A6J4UM84_9BACT|nr:MAG: hypothetical protein AVDCRST_MAG33-898 [uncultured Thermomicrobiales bacterium]